jgi:hypothetical protein
MSRLNLHLTVKFNFEEIYNYKNNSNLFHGLYQTQLLHTNLYMVRTKLQ